MALPLLLPLLASLQSLPRPVTPAGLLPPPILMGRATYQEYLPGELVRLMCSPPHGEQAGGYRFSFRKGQQVLLIPTAEPWLEFPAERGRAGSYTCAYWRQDPEGTKSSRWSNSISITVTAPKLTVSPQQPVYIAGENVTFTCSAAGVSRVSGIRFFRDSHKIHSMELPFLRDSYTDSLQLSGPSGSHTGVYSCEFWKTVSGRELLSETISPIPITVTDPPPQPVLTVDPPSGMVSEGLPLLLTCTAPGDTDERRFHFYKDGVEFVPRDAGSEINTMEPSSRSVKGSVLSIPRASPSDSGEFTCGYEDNVSGRWVLSLQSQAVNVTVNATRTALSFLWVLDLYVGGIFFLINGLILLISCCSS